MAKQNDAPICYFKITNADEKHKGFQYVDGLNTLKGNFSETGSCVSGGLYFTCAKYIFKFLSYGMFVREITFPESDPEFKMVKDPDGDKWRANKIILGKRYEIADPNTLKMLVEKGARIRYMANDYITKFCEINSENIKFFVQNGCIDSLGKILVLKGKENNFDNVKYLVENGLNVQSDSNSLVMSTCKNGNLEMLKYLHKKGAYLRDKSEYALSEACKYGHLHIVEYLLSNGLSANNQNAFETACENGHVSIVKYLLEKKTRKLKIRTAVQKSCEKGFFDIVKLLLENRKTFKPWYNEAFVTACKNGNMFIVEYLFDKGTDVSYRNYHSLMEAIAYKHLSVIEFLFEKIKLDDTNTNLFVKGCIESKNVGTVKFFMDKGIDFKDHFSTIFKWSVENNNLDVVKKLVEENYQLENNDMVRRICRTKNLEMFKVVRKNIVYPDGAFRIVCEHKNLEMAKLLVEDATVKKLTDALKSASISDYSELMKYLVDAGATIENSIFERACSNGNVEFVKYCMQKGMVLKDHQKYLRLACDNNKIEMVKFLLDNGADLSKGKIYLLEACKCGHLEIVKFLVEKGVDYSFDNYKPIVVVAKKDYSKILKFLVEHRKTQPDIPATKPAVASSMCFNS